MKIVVLPFNAAEGTSPALGRQMANFVAEVVRANSQAEVNAVSYLSQVEDGGQQRAMFVNLSDTLLEPEFLKDMFQRAEGEMIMDGLIKRVDDDIELTARLHKPGEETPFYSESWNFRPDGVFERIHGLVLKLAAEAGETLPDEIVSNMEFGTDNGRSFLNFLEGYDAVMYIQQSAGAVTMDFSPQPAADLLLKSVEEDKDFVAPFDSLISLCRACGQYRIGTFEVLINILNRSAELEPKDFKPLFAMGELYAGIGENGMAADMYERAIDLDSTEPALYSRLGLAQLAAGMPVNAERNFRKALEMEDETKPSADFLADVLTQTNRIHEVPVLWKGIIDENPQNALAQAKYAVALVNAGKPEDGEKAFETALEVVEENVIVKRWYAPYLANAKQDLDRAMDFYEDCIDVAPNDIQLLSEYARTLISANREFEAPEVLKQILQSNPDPNTRAEVLAWLIELEQPKRVESVMSAQKKMEAGDFETAARELKPLRNWLRDYWKMWALLAACLNHLGAYNEAEEAAGTLVQLYPGCEPGYGELMTALSGQDRKEEAYNVMRFGATNLPQSLGIHVNLALAAKRAGHEDEAKALAKQIREAVGPNPELEEVLQEIEA